MTDSSGSRDGPEREDDLERGDEPEREDGPDWDAWLAGRTPRGPGSSSYVPEPSGSPPPRYLQLRSGSPARDGERPPGVIPLDRAHRHIRLARRAMDRAAKREGWPVPFSPVRFLVLGHLHRGSAFGFTPVTIARKLEIKRSSLAHHLDVLESAEMIERGERSFGDARTIALRLTERGLYALWSLGSALERAGLGRPTPR